MTRRKKIKIAAALAGVATVGALTVAPANADCIRAEVYYRTGGGTNQYVHGPRECVGPDLGYPQGASAWEDVPLGVGAVGGGVWVPVPPFGPVPGTN